MRHSLLPIAALSTLLAACGIAGNTPHPSDAGFDAPVRKVDAGDATAPLAGFTVYVPASTEAAATSFFEYLPEARATVNAVTDPVASASAATGPAVRVAVVTDLTCGECYQVSPGAAAPASTGALYTVHAGGVLGAQYGLAELLEAFDFRFFHPWGSKVPASLAAQASAPGIGPVMTPEMSLRGLHLHTLHPIEGYYTFWASDVAGGLSADAGASGIDGAKRVIDWVVKNRGNYVEWSALNDIVSGDAAHFAAWKAHTSAILTYAHARGIKVGVGTELFGTSNLQLSFDLLDQQTDPNAKATVDTRLHLLLDGLPWDIVDLSFGEFSGTDPNLFLTSVDLAYTELQAIAPGTTMAATIHVGSGASLEVTYQGQQLLYYFLVQYADPHIVPWIHTVMYFDLFQPADGAYGMTSFDQHLGYLQKRLQAGQPAAYYPESAYWVAFDSSVPTYLPVYIRSRWLDVTKLAAAAKAGGYAPLDQHVLFTSGWEWGYWQNDYATLRMNFAAPAAWTDPVDAMFAPWGAKGAALATQVGALGELQSSALIDQALAAYIAGQDGLLALGASGGIISQPVRTTLAQVSAMNATDLAAFTTSVLGPLEALDTSTQAIAATVAGLGLDPKDPWLAETTDGIAVDAARVHFVASLYQAAASFASTGADGGFLAKADAALGQGKAIVSRRHAALHYPDAAKLLGANANATYYQTGYLTEADTLCYWTRERLQARALILADTTPPPNCVP